MTSAVAGIDIGGPRKGCHLVVLRGSEILCNINSRNPLDLLEHCIKHDVIAIGVDAPCAWGIAGVGRIAERELAKERIFFFSTPTRERATSSSFYGWMLSGEQVYHALAAAYPLLPGPNYTVGRVCFETFPHAITCALLGRDAASAKMKNVQRRALLAQAGITADALKSIDAVDAALCALTARYLLDGQVHAYGDTAGGFILVPRPSASNC